MQWNFFGVEREYIWSLLAGYWGRIPRWQIALIFLIFAPTIYILMPLFIAGMVYSWKHFPLKNNLLWVLAYFLAVTFIYYGFSRHRTPLNPMMAAFAGYALAAGQTIFEDFKVPGIFRRPATAITLGLVAFFVIGWALEIFLDAGSFFSLGFTHELWKDVSIGQ